MKAVMKPDTHVQLKKKTHAQVGDYYKEKGVIRRVVARRVVGRDAYLTTQRLSPGSSPGIGRVCPICRSADGCGHEIEYEPDAGPGVT